MAATPANLKSKGFNVQHFDKNHNTNQIEGQVLCAVPEKIRQLVQKKHVSLGNVRYIVVDEADNTVMNDKNDTVIAIMKNLIETGNLNWKLILCGATIQVE